MDEFATIEGNKIKIEIKKRKPNALKGKTLLFVGSSYTVGHTSLGVAFPEYIALRNDCKCVKEAVSGTTLVEHLPDSYITRLRQVPLNSEFDLFLCQLSTNDAWHEQELGIIKDSDYDTNTICGAIQFIAEYSRNILKCPIMFYTSPYYANKRYQDMVKALHKISRKMNFKVIDLYSDKKFNAISKEDYNLYMVDPVHPTKAGYYYWITPLMERGILDFFKKKVT